MRIVVAGGAGFIGSHLCEFLLGQGNQVICIDNLLTGDRKNIDHLSSNQNFSFIDKDIVQGVGGIELRVDQIYHLASPASPEHYRKHSLETLLVNSIGTLNLLNLAKEKRSRFLLASTSEVYGDPKEHPQKESYFGNVNPIGPRSMYDEGKRFAEALTMDFIKKGLEGVIIRIFNTYGPRMQLNDGRVVPNFIAQALKNQPLSVYGDGSQTRSFCYISDMVSGFVAAMEKGKMGEVYNIGNLDEFKILDFAKLVKETVKSSSEIVFKPLPQDDPKQRRPDISKAKSELGWEPKVRIEEGLKSTIEYFSKQI